MQNMSRKLLLIYPPKMKMESAKAQADISLALLYLAGVSKAVCDQIELFDMGLVQNDYNRLAELIDEMKPSVVGINCLFSGIFPKVRELAKFIKQREASIKIITGGIHPTMFADEIMENCPEIDVVFEGESDEAFPKVLRYLYGEKELITELDSVTIRNEQGSVTKFPKKCYISDLDSLPMPAYELVHFDDYQVDMSNWYNPKEIKLNNKVAPLLTSRSCPNACNFCAMRLVMGRKLRTRSAKSVFEEIKHLYDNYGINYFHIMDDNFTFDKSRTIEICKMIVESGIKIAFDCPNGIMIRTLDDEVIEWLAKAGMCMAHIAVESGSDNLRNKVMRKNVSAEKILSVSKALRKNGIAVMIFLLFGLPEESPETIDETIEFLQKMEFDAYSLNILLPLPGTELFEQVKRDNLLTDNFRLENQWQGEFVKESTPGNMAVQFYVKPYAFAESSEIRGEYDRLKMFLDEKCKGWIEHTKNGTPYTIL